MGNYNGSNYGFDTNGGKSHKASWWKKFLSTFRAPFGSQISMTTTIIVVTVIFYLITQLSNNAYFALLFFPQIALAQPWRFFTAALLHAGLLHLFFNMYSLWLLGAAVEPVIGKWKYLGLYLFSAFTGNLFAYAYALWLGNPNLFLVGASGAIFGVFGALLILTRHLRGNTTGIMIVLAINLLIGLLNSHISWQAHLGGFLGGLIYTWIVVRLMIWRRRRRS